MIPKDIAKISLPLLIEVSSSLPATPRVFSRLNQLVQDEDASLDYIASLLKMDPGLSAHILRVTNSAFYGAAIKVTSMETAISRIGFKQIQAILSELVEHDSFYQALPCYGISATQFSNDNLNVGVASETISKRIGTDPDAAYLTGLLHSLGKLCIDLYLAKVDKVFDIPLAAGERILQKFEYELLGLNHYRAGAELLKHWQFEDNIWQAIKNQSSPENTVTFTTATAVLALAIWVPAQLNGYDSQEDLPESVKWALKKLQIDALDVAAIIDECRFEINDRHNMLSMLL